MKKILILWVLSSLLFSCQDASEETTATEESTSTPAIHVPSFNADSAYASIEKQVAFGPRVPGSSASKKCAPYLIEAMKRVSDTCYIQETTVFQPISNKKYPCTNIIGVINPQATNRILLLAHWDSRAWADEDSQNKLKPIDAADDGASGVAVILEIGRLLKAQTPHNIGVDLLLVDVEDMGKTEWTGQSYCLGTQYWAKNPHVAGYKARFGICLDMVGAQGATFPLEAFSKNYAGNYQKEIWDAGNQLGYSSFFLYQEGGAIDDDHIAVNEIAKIPCVDIINLKPSGGFGDHWHTHQDNLSVIDKNTLKAIGQTVLQVIYQNQ